MLALFVEFAEMLLGEHLDLDLRLTL